MSERKGEVLEQRQRSRTKGYLRGNLANPLSWKTGGERYPGSTKLDHSHWRLVIFKIVCLHTFSKVYPLSPSLKSGKLRILQLGLVLLEFNEVFLGV